MLKDGHPFSYVKPEPIYEFYDKLIITIDKNLELKIESSLAKNGYSQCGKLACLNGTPTYCSNKPGQWSHKMVICEPPNKNYLLAKGKLDTSTLELSL